jgi:hypothetical protein
MQQMARTAELGAPHLRRAHTIRLKTVGTLVTNPRMAGERLVAAEGDVVLVS